MVVIQITLRQVYGTDTVRSVHRHNPYGRMYYQAFVLNSTGLTVLRHQRPRGGMSSVECDSSLWLLRVVVVWFVAYADSELITWRQS